ncbi:NTP-PPase domain containing protein [uncultured Caudovirales phage]|uniref:NTP-PPase domain containing protein n=1 Tax=uncultured Caudovirales phage TaxID=2100421 RepID=A0A6J5M081_9CAUD|nr:NTP-PPase domain containing protein [uncultured Caudovirales phage]
MDTLTQLRAANTERFEAWAGHPNSVDDALFNATELGGECGELLNIVKKLHRAAKGWKGSAATVQDLADEAADVIICVDKLVAPFGIDLRDAVVRKFNAASEKNGFPHRMNP